MTLVGGPVVPSPTAGEDNRTILEVIQDAAPLLGIAVPSAVYGTTGQTERELGRIANEMARRIRDAHDWSALKILMTASGDGSDTQFDLPSDYLRMPKAQQVWSTSSQQPLSRVATADDWLRLDLQNYTSLYGAWIILQNQLNVIPAPAVGELIKFYYITRYMAQSSDGVAKTRFTADTDVFLLDDRVLELGIVAAFRTQKGLDAEAPSQAFTDALTKAISYDRGARIITQAGRTVRGDTYAYPWTITP